MAATYGHTDIQVTPHDILRFNWNEDAQDYSKNESKVGWALSLISDGYGAIYSNPLREWYVNVDGQEYSGSVSVAIGNNETKILAHGQTTVKHNVDGSKTFSYSFSQVFNITFSDVWRGKYSGSGTGTLNKIPRAATLTGAPDFNDEQSPNITYSNPAGNAVESLKACINYDGTINVAAYREIPKTDNNYTFILTDEERSNLRNNIVSGNTRKIRFYLCTVIGGVEYYDTLEKTVSLINANPIINPVAYDTSTLTTGLTGDANKIIKGYNSVYVNSNAQAIKGAYITSQSIICGSKYVTSSNATCEGYLDYIESPDIVFTTTDNRGNTTKQTLTKEMINYFSPIAKMNVSTKLDATGEEAKTATATIDFSGMFFNSSFGKENNTFNLEYQIRGINEEYGDTWLAATVNPSGNDFTAQVIKQNLPYRETYAIRARYRDKIRYGNLYISEQIIKAVPVFDWSGEDFNFNVPVSGVNINVNNVLWSGAALMGEGNSLTLSQPISEQPHGIALVFSGFINGGAVNYYISTHIVPKALVAALPGVPHTFMMVGDAQMAYAGAKYF